MILGFLPRDVIEAMLAGHCVMLHELMTANVRTDLRDDADPTRRGPRSNVVGLNKAFNDNLDRLERHRKRSAEGSRDASAAPMEPTPEAAGSPPQPGAAPREPRLMEQGPMEQGQMEQGQMEQGQMEQGQMEQGPMEQGPMEPRQMERGPNRAARRQAARAEVRSVALASRAGSKCAPSALAKSAPGPSAAAAINGRRSPSPQAVADCKANPEAMAALQAGDPAGFARAMGIEHPSEAFLAAARTEGSPFDLHASGPWTTGALAHAPNA
jgi:hypothetical protein